MGEVGVWEVGKVGSGGGGRVGRGFEVADREEVHRNRRTGIGGKRTKELRGKRRWCRRPKGE